MCGHGTIGTCTVLVEAGLVPVTEPVTAITLDTPAGLVRARVAVEGGIARSVTIQNVPSFLYRSGLEVQVPELGPVVLDIAYGGNFYAIVPAERVGLELVPRCAKEIVRKGCLIREAIFQQVEVQHPLLPAVGRCSHVRFVSQSGTPGVTTRNAVLYSAEAIDRSPCGTGTSAEMAARFAKGQQRIGEEMVSESIIGSLFHGNLVEETTVGPFPAVVPTIRGSAYVSGIHQVVLDDRDPFPEGFYLGESSKWGAQFN